MIIVLGGIGGLMLAIFHKIERKKIKSQCCSSGRENSSERQHLVRGMV